MNEIFNTFVGDLIINILSCILGGSLGFYIGRKSTLRQIGKMKQKGGINFGVQNISHLITKDDSKEG